MLKPLTLMLWRSEPSRCVVENGLEAWCVQMRWGWTYVEGGGQAEVARAGAAVGGGAPFRRAAYFRTTALAPPVMKKTSYISSSSHPSMLEERKKFVSTSGVVKANCRKPT